MYKGKRLDQSSIIHKSFSTSLLNESTNQVFEREIDNYTRLLEQDKRKFFRVQEHRDQVAKEYTKKAKELELLKSKQFKTATLKMKGKLKVMENELDQTVNSYNNVLASNKKLKDEIDELRKAKLSKKEVMGKMTSRIEEYSELLAQQLAEIEHRKQGIEQDKQGILTIKAQNECEAKMFRGEVGGVQINLANSRSGSQNLKRKSEAQANKQGTDTQPLVKHRLRHILLRNKERVKIIDNYRKTMEAIWKSFEQIKQESGISDLEEITSSFLKHEQQNHFIYEYIGKLNRDMEDLDDSIEGLSKKIENQKGLNQSYLEDLGATPKQQLARVAAQKFQEGCEKDIKELEIFLRSAEPELKELGGEQELTRLNLTEELARIQEMINQNYPVGDDSSNNFHQEATRYTKGPPGYSEEVKQNREERLMDADKLREFASDFWEKRKVKPQVK